MSAATPTVALWNQSTVLTDAQVQAILPALQAQVTNDFTPIWGASCNLIFVGKTQQPQKGAWWLSILDNADQAGALGYHDVTPEGLPLAKVFAHTTIQNDCNWTVTVSHELCEMLADPDIARCYLDDKSAKLYALEVCDAPEGDQFGYKIGEVLVSDFVYPAFFESFQVGKKVPFDHTGHITAPFQILADGYLSVLDLNNLSKGWQELNRHGEVAPKEGLHASRVLQRHNFWDHSSER